MMQVPLHPGTQKVGECGRIDWFRSGKFLQFQNSFFMNDKLHLKLKVETELMMLREGLQLNKTYKKIRLASLMVVLALFVYLGYILLLDPSDSNGRPDPNYSSNIWIGYLVFFIVLMIILVFQIVMLRRMFHAIKMGILAVNNKMQMERVNAYLILKQENCCQQYWGQLWNRMNFVQVYEYVGY